MKKIEMVLISDRNLSESVVKEMMYLLEFDVKKIEVKESDEEYANYNELLDRLVGG